MKSRVVVGMGLMGVLMASGLHAQESTVPESTLKVVRIRPNLDPDKLQYILSTERKVVFERNMDLDEQQSEIFWGVYHQYEKEKDQLEAKRFAYSGPTSKFSSLTNDDVMKIIKQSSENQQADLALKKYFHIYSKGKSGCGRSLHAVG